VGSTEVDFTEVGSPSFCPFDMVQPQLQLTVLKLLLHGPSIDRIEEPSYVYGDGDHLLKLKSLDVGQQMVHLQTA